MCCLLGQTLLALLMATVLFCAPTDLHGAPPHQTLAPAVSRRVSTTGWKGSETERSAGQLVEQLGDANFFVRQQAQEELTRRGFEAFEALDAATHHADLEIVLRAERLLALMQERLVREDDPAEVQALLRDFSRQNRPTKLKRMARLAQLPEQKGVAALCRLVQFEAAAELSKQAALEILGMTPYGKSPPSELAETLRANLIGNRVATRWLFAWLRLAAVLPGGGAAAEDGTANAAALAAAHDDWAKLVATEYALVLHAPEQTRRGIVAELVRHQAAWLKRGGREDDSIAALHRLIDLEQGTMVTLSHLLAWFCEQKAWTLVDALSRRFPAQFSGNPRLLYVLAEAQLEQGPGAKAEATAQQAFRLNPGKSRSQLNRHLEVGHRLLLNKRNRWAARELRHVVERSEENANALRLLAECLIRLEAWDEIIALPTAHPEPFKTWPVLLYIVATAQHEMGDLSQAEATAQQAFAIAREKTPGQLRLRLAVVVQLQYLGRFAWAERECRYVIDAPDAALGRLFLPKLAASNLAEQFHDQGKDLAAATLLEELLERPVAQEKWPDYALGMPAIRARMYYLQSCHWKTQNDRPKYRAALAKALEANSADVDVLIAHHRLPDQTPEQRGKTRRLIADMAADYRAQIKISPYDYSLLNQFAWLVGNTEGDLDEALDCSKRSLQIRPDAGAYYDTLAHVYASKGDVDAAVKAQTKACELDPHSKQIAVTLERFRKMQRDASRQP